MLKYLLLLLLLWCPVSLLIAQPSSQSWKKRVNAADDMYEQGNYASAAEYYWSAYKVKPTKYDLAYKAGECFALVRDYKNASKAYGAVREFHKELVKVNLFRGMSLKNEGKYQQAVAEFEYFISVYQKSDKADVYQEVLNEISGCQMAMEAQKTTSTEYYIEHMGYSVNSSLTEFAPIPVGNNIIYFSSMVDGSAKVYRTQRDANKWTKRSKVQFFNDIEQPHFGNGSFTPDGKRFYFTQCQITDAGKTICQIYVIKKTGEDWDKPTKLPDFVNEIGSTNTHPNVILEGTREIIYFASDRETGQGGMDIWYVIRNLNAADESYTMPVNLGSTVNTAKDEITPFYDAGNETLYFSSNGHINVGGYDVFKTKGNKTTWATPSNLGAPFNSSADDMYYILKEGSEAGYMVSNRFIRPDKISTLDDDVFVFGLNNELPLSEIKVNIGGLVVDYEKSVSVALESVQIDLFEVDKNEKQTLVESLDSPDGRYEFTVEGGKHYRIEAKKAGYLDAFFDLMTFEVKEPTEIDQNIPLERIPGETVASESTTTPPPVQPEEEPVAESPAETETDDVPTSTETESGSNPNVLPINPATGQPLPGRENDFGEPVHKEDLSTYEQYSLILTSDENLAYLRKDDLWVPVTLGAVTESGVAESEPVNPPPVEEEPSIEEISSELPPVVEQPPIVEETPVEQPVVEEPKIVEETPVEQPKVEEPEIVEELVVEEPRVEEPTLPVPPPPVETEEVVEETPLPTPVEEVTEEVSLPEVEEVIKEVVEESPIIETPEKGPLPTEEMTKETVESIPVEIETFDPVTEVEKSAAAIEYKIQLVAVKVYQDHRYSRVKDLGPIEFEDVDTDAHGLLTRVLITGFPDARTARRALAKAKVRGFGRAFAIRYEKGERVGVPLR